MKPRATRFHGIPVLRPAAVLCLAGLLTGAGGSRVASPVSALGAAPAPVTVTEDATAFTLDNGVITAKVDKVGGTLLSLHYRGREMLNGNGRSGSYWSHRPGGPHVVDTITINPAANGGERAEISIKSAYEGRPQGSGPGGSTACDLEVRYTLNRNDPGLYTTSIFTHKPGYPATGIGEARFLIRLNDDLFDWMTVDSRRSKKMLTASDWNLGTPLNMKEARRLTTGIYKGEVEHKYDYCAVQADTPAFGWSSTQEKVGVWMINPSMEYLSGGPTKLEILAHRDATFNTTPTTPAPPCLLNYWRGSHYGGSECEMAADESWTKVIGPMYIYCNTGPDPKAQQQDALERARQEANAWPYDWVTGADYPHASERGTISGQIVLSDPQAPGAKMTDLRVGLAHPDYTTARGATVDWQNDAKFYEFWTRGEDDGRFTLRAIRPGAYTLHAIATGVLGEYTGTAPITVAPGQKMDLGKIVWTPVRHGRQLWDIGIPDRTAGEFRHGDDYWHWGLYNRYPQEFPNDVHFVIGKSDYHRDWNYAQVPRAQDDSGKGTGPATTWTVVFNVPRAGYPLAGEGRATLRLSLAGSTAKEITVGVNGQMVGSTGPIPDTATIRRDAIRGYWRERDVAFDAALLKAGENTLTLTIPAGNVMNGVEYDYLRLEVDEKAR